MSDEINRNQPGMQGRRESSGVPPRMPSGNRAPWDSGNGYYAGRGSDPRYQQPGPGGYPYCGDPRNAAWNRYQAPVAPHAERPQSNAMGTAGFVLSLISVFLGWIPYCGWAIWLLAVVFSAIGLGRRPRGLAAAGLIISVAIPLLLVIAVLAFGLSLAFLSAGM